MIQASSLGKPTRKKICSYLEIVEMALTHKKVPKTVHNDQTQAKKVTQSVWIGAHLKKSKNNECRNILNVLIGGIVKGFFQDLV